MRATPNARDWLPPPTPICGRIVVLVDDDVDPSNLADVMWAVATRAEPSEDVDIVRNAWSSALDPRLDPAARDAGLTSNSKMIIDACIPFQHRDAYPKTSALSIEEAQQVRARWKDVFDSSVARSLFQCTHPSIRASHGGQALI